MPLVIKKIVSKAGARMTERDVEALIRYVRTARRQDSAADAEEKLVPGFSGCLNMGGDSTEAQLVWMLNLRRANTRAQRPFLHHVLSWEEGAPRPTPVQVEEAVGILQRRLGLEGCAVLWSAHQNTQDFHVHAVMSQLDPETLKMRRIGMDERKAMEAKAEIEHAFGLGHYEADVFTTAPDGSVVRNAKRKPKATPPLSSGARDGEHRTGEACAERLAQERAWPVIVAATSWEDIHAGLAGIGCRLVTRKGGLALQIGDVWVKGSKVSRQCSRKALEKRLGPWKAPVGPVPRPGEIAPKRKSASVSPEPETETKEIQSVVGSHLVVPAPGMDDDDELWEYWQLYRQDHSVLRREQQRWAEERAVERKAVMERVRAGVRRAGQLVREARSRGEHFIRGVQGVFRQVLEMDGRRRRREVSARQQTNAGSRPRFADSFASWLRAHGRADLADRWRRRSRTESLSAWVRMRTKLGRQHAMQAGWPMAGARLTLPLNPAKSMQASPATPTVKPVPESVASVPAPEALDLFALARRLRGQESVQVPLSVPQVMPEPEDEGPSPGLS